MSDQDDRDDEGERVVEVERDDFSGNDGKLVKLMGTEIQFQRLIILPHVPIAEVGVIVKCNIKGYFFSVGQMKRLCNEPFEVLDNQYYQVGEGDAIPGLELALRHSRKGEKMRSVFTSKFGFGSAGRGVTKNAVESAGSAEATVSTTNPITIERTKSGMAIIPPNMDLEYEIEIVDHLQEKMLHQQTVEKYRNDLTAVEGDEEAKDKLVHRLYTIQSMNYRKEAGNRWFSFEDYDRSARAYSHATKLAEGYFNSGNSNTVLEEATTMEERIKAIEEKERQKSEPVAEEDSEIVGLYVTCLNNLAACKLSKGEHMAAKELCVKVLQFSPFNGKALLRAAKATLALDSFEECDLCLKRLISIEQMDDTIKNAAKIELAKLRKAQADYKAKLKQMQQKMATKLFNKEKTSASAEVVPETVITPTSPSSPTVSEAKQEKAAAQSSSLDEKSNEKEQEQAQVQESAVDTGKDAKSETTTSATATTATKAEAPAKGGGNNMMLLVATSLAVVLFSLVIAYIYR